ncbi:unnamed protein product [Psylliodes chrysocephalus]|uniref:Uncharacterized protein n=1 Tax=Psylliodes chrysocephalus TaxID=3402493 RepID=A0A9P0D1H0_9CUCU|nr:unnamed protein product [Psylliodes chrysocephala]
MFLRTIGLKTDGIITQHMLAKQKNNGLPKVLDERGKTNKNKENNHFNDDIAEHIESYNPQVSHYNLQHAPHRRYLTCDLSIRVMWKNFCLNPEKKVSYIEKIFASKNISFAQPSQDECSQCSLFKLHKIEHATADGLSTDNFKKCSSFLKHKETYTQAREAYKKDKASNSGHNHIVYAVDMQKVILIPKMPLKNIFFESRLVVFNETFACMGKNKIYAFYGMNQ